MEIRDLKAFTAVVLAGTVTDAAAKLRLTQSAVSRQIARLEDQLRFSLFERSGRRLRLTPEGTAFLREAERLIAGYEEIWEAAANIKQGRLSHVRIVAMPTLAHGLLPDALAAFRSDNPEISISVDVKGRNEVARWVAARQFDVGLVALPVANQSVRSDAFVRTGVLAAVPAGHPLAKNRRISLKLLASEPLIGLSSDSVMQHRINQALERLGKRTRLVIDTSSLISVCHFVGSGNGCGIVDPFTAHAAKSDRIAFLPLELDLGLEFGLIVEKAQNQSPQVAALCETVRATARTILSDLSMD